MPTLPASFTTIATAPAELSNLKMDFFRLIVWLEPLPNAALTVSDVSDAIAVTVA